jgi:hypothetical protein
MKRNNYIQPRGDYFYYLEVWNKSLLRDSLISTILDEDLMKPYYVNGSQRQLNRVNKIECALFWKNEGMGSKAGEIHFFKYNPCV